MKSIRTVLSAPEVEAELTVLSFFRKVPYFKGLSLIFT